MVPWRRPCQKLEKYNQRRSVLHENPPSGQKEQQSLMHGLPFRYSRRTYLTYALLASKINTVIDWKNNNCVYA